GPARRADAAGRVGRVGRAGPDAPRLVDDAVAVVVHAVANFGRARRRRRVAEGARAVGAADQASHGRAGADLNRAGTAHGEAVVDRAIAVVMEAVADLGPRADLALALHLAGGAVADQLAGPADAAAGGRIRREVAVRGRAGVVAGIARAGNVVVDDAVAVVVDVVAGFGGWAGGAAALRHAHHALEGAGPAGADVGSAAAAE